jgi:hypothetical protein
MPTYPLTLPQYFDAGSWTEEPPDVLLETPMDAGPYKTRRRFTAGFRPVEGAITYSYDEYLIFDAFFESTLLFGAIPFDWVRPSTRAACVMQFRKKGVTYSDLEAGNVLARMRLYILP